MRSCFIYNQAAAGFSAAVLAVTLFAVVIVDLLDSTSDSNAAGVTENSDRTHVID